MSKENLERKRNGAESRWEAIQLQAANAQRELDYAIALFEKHKDELSTKDQESTMAKIDEQKQAIKSYLLRGYQVHEEAQRAYESGMKRLHA